MKKYILSAIAVVGALAMTSCSDFLDVQPEGKPTTTTYFTNDQQAIDAVDMLYGRLHQENVFGREFFWEQGGGQDVVWGRDRSGYRSLATHDYNGDESPLRSTFEQFYNTMARANWIIEKLTEKEKSTGLTAVEKRSLGEAIFVRGICHFYVAYRYGTDKQGVPFVRYEDAEGGYNYTIPEQSATVMDDYRMIIEDMDKAMTYLPKVEEYDEANLGRAHKAACVAYKAKTYAYWACWDKSKWNDVITCVNELESQYGRDLNPSYDELFCSDTSKFFNKEYLWSIPGYGGDTPGGSEFPGVILENKGWGKYNGWGQNKPSYNLYAELLKDGTTTTNITYEDRVDALDGKTYTYPTHLKNIRYEQTTNGYYVHFRNSTEKKFDENGKEISNWETEYNNEKVFVNSLPTTYEKGNARLERNILEYGREFQFFGETRTFFSAVDIEVGFTCNKYMQAFEDADCVESGKVSGNGDWPTTRVNFPLIRMAEMYLFRAEAKIMKGENGDSDINKVRARVGLTPVSGATMANVMHERRCELAFEFYDALYDLKRWHKSCPELKTACNEALSKQPQVRHYEDRSNPESACTVGDYDANPGRLAYDDHYMVFPYPSQVITESNGALKQNAGYAQ